MYSLNADAREYGDVLQAVRKVMAAARGKAE